MRFAVLEIPQYAAWGLLLIFVSVGAAHLLRVRRDKHSATVKAADDASLAVEKAAREKHAAYELARDDFLKVVDPLLGALKSKPMMTSPQAGWHNTFSEVKRVVDHLSRHLEPDDRARFEEEWTKYRTVNRELLKSEMIKLETGSMGISYARGASIIVPLLETMKSFAR